MASRAEEVVVRRAFSMSMQVRCEEEEKTQRTMQDSGEFRQIENKKMLILCK